MARHYTEMLATTVTPDIARQVRAIADRNASTVSQTLRRIVVGWVRMTCEEEETARGRR